MKTRVAITQKQYKKKEVAKSIRPMAKEEELQDKEEKEVAKSIAPMAKEKELQDKGEEMVKSTEHSENFLLHKTTNTKFRDLPSSQTCQTQWITLYLRKFLRNHHLRKRT
jgi:hypothetical protein